MPTGSSGSSRATGPCRDGVVVTFVNAPGEPEYLTVIKEWKLDQDVEAAQFKFEVPADWRRIDVPKLSALPQSNERQAASTDPGQYLRRSLSWRRKACAPGFDTHPARRLEPAGGPPDEEPSSCLHLFGTPCRRSRG